MGCDIHSLVEVKTGGRWEPVKDRIFPMSFVWDNHTHTSEPFNWRYYGMFAFLADVRNYSFVPPLSLPRGLPDNLSEYAREFFDNDNYHSRSFLTLQELLAFDYDRTFEDRRCMRDGNGVADTGKGNGRVVTFREFLGQDFFRDLEIIKGLAPVPDDVRVVFAFDN